MKDKKFNIPKNIKQIGSLDPSLKIYIEDYAFTFMQQYSKENQQDDKIAILIGEECNIDGSNVLFISGVIKPKYTTFQNSMETLTEKSFDYIQEQIDIYFPNLKVVGWFYSRAGFEKEINQNYIKYHKENFLSDNKVLFLNDPLEKTFAFFKFSQKYDNFTELKGFIIYYERNEAMSEYMLSNQFLSNPELKEKKAKEAKLKNSKEKEIKKQTKEINNSKDFNLKEVENKENINKEIKTSKPTTIKKTLTENKKSVNIFGTLTAVLILVSFIMGAGLIQSEDRITRLENQIARIDETYRYLLLQVTNESVQNVFAETSSDNSYSNEENNVNEQTNNYEESNINIDEQTNYKQQNDTTSQDNQSLYENQEVENTSQLVQQQTSYDRIKEQENSYTENVIQENSYEVYVVKDGDSLEKISRQFYGGIEKINEIMLINQIEDPNKIYAGMSIKLP